MPKKGAQQAIVAVVVGVGFVLAIIATGTRGLDTAWTAALKLYSIATTTVGLMFLAHDRWLWRLRPLRFGHPRLAGTWRGTLDSTHVADDGEEFKGLTVHLLVRQTFGALSATLLSDRSESESMAATLSRSDDGRWHIAFTYRNAPRPGERASSAPHRGACDLVVGGAQGERLQGSYFTDRKSSGGLVFDRWSATFYGDQATASSGRDFVEHRSLG